MLEIMFIFSLNRTKQNDVLVNKKTTRISLFRLAIDIINFYILFASDLLITIYNMSLKTSTLGFPRTGPKREMKTALEKYWNGLITADELISTSDSIAVKSYEEQLSRGVDFIGVGDHTLYDHILDWSERFGLTCSRVKDAGLTGLDAYFTQARGRDGIPALDMTKYFDSNYHYMVPEVPGDVVPAGNFKEFIRQMELAQRTVGKEKATPIVVGPLTLCKLCKLRGNLSFRELLTLVLPCYEQLLKELKQIGVQEVQFHEPWLVKSEAVSSDMKEVAELLYGKGSNLTKAKSGVSVNLCIHFDSVHSEVYKYIINLDVERLTLDFCRSSSMLSVLEKEGFPSSKVLGAGVVDGRNVWKSSESVAKLLGRIRKVVGDNVVVSPSCSLQFIPYDLSIEKELPSEVREKLAFAVQKLDVLVAVAASSSSSVCEQYLWIGEDNISGAEDISKATKVGEVMVTEDMFSRSEEFKVRRAKQISVPCFPTTTIGSFPQTPELRRSRLAWKQQKLSEADYRAVIDAELKKNIEIQNDIGLDVLVHGEPERSDMVEHFGQRLDGFTFTNHGWVQSYGSRYVRPPIICGTVSRKEEMTVREFKVAQAASNDKPVKGMLTGPVTILNWSFCRVDTPRWKQALEVALAIREEVADLEAAGCRVVQVDEAALRERMPLKDEEAASYMSWAVKAFRLSTAVAKPSTQIVTHMCYSTFEDIINKIDEMDADVLTIENSRSGNEMLDALSQFGYNRDIGPGVYDIHSPVIPTKEQLVSQVRKLVESGLPLDRIWVNPDCGLKTRKWEEVVPSLKNMVAAAKTLREQIPSQRKQ